MVVGSGPNVVPSACRPAITQGRCVLYSASGDVFVHGTVESGTTASAPPSTSARVKVWQCCFYGNSRNLHLRRDGATFHPL